MGIAKLAISSIICSSSSKKTTAGTTTAVQAAATTETATTTITTTHHPFTTSISNNINKEENNNIKNNCENSMSHEYHQPHHHPHHNQAANIFTFPNGFDRSAGLAQEPTVAPTVDDPSEGLHDHHHHHHHQNQNHQVYETAGMLSEMFNFSHAPGPGHTHPGPDLLDYRRPVGGPLEPTDWYGSNRPVSRDDDHQHHHIGDHQMGGISAHDSAAAMQLFLTNPPPKSPSPPSQPPQQPPPPNIQQVMGGGGFHTLTNNDPTNSTTPNHANFWSNTGLSGIIEGQGLSLSLSSSLQHLEAAKQVEEEFRQISGGPSGGDNNNPHNIMFFNQHQPNVPGVVGPSTTAPTTSPGGQFFKNLAPGPHPLQPMGGFGGQNQVQLGYGSAATSSLGVVNVLRNSKYAKPAQELLEEFCSVGRGQIKKPKLGRQNSSNQNPTTSGGGGSGGGKGGSSSSSKDPPQLSPADRIEHQRRKVKLLAMLDEVDRRYNHYCEQMQMVVNSFDLIMGYGAAIPYTALAQKAMSRHFRCLKDAIHVQLKHSCEMLGEKDPTTGSGITKGETPRLKVLEQSLRQQRAFHQMGMMDQEAWRPQRGLPERSVNILRAWLFEHFLHPYPSDADKHLLARQTGLSRNQIPEKVAKKIISLQTKFFWGGDADHRKLALIKWKDLETPKDLGGLGIGSLKLKNLGLLLKWWLRYCNENGALWKQILRSVHNLPQHFISIPELKQVKHGPLHELAKATLKIPWFEKVVSSSFHLKLGNGNTIKFWHDPWLHNEPLKLKFPRLFSLSSQQCFTICDVGLWDGEKWNWNFTWRRPFFVWEESLFQNLLELLKGNNPLSNSSQDCLSWIHDSKGFSVRSFTSNVSTLIYPRLLSEKVVKLVWQKVSPPRAEILVWSLMQGKLKTGATILELGLIEANQANCPFCSNHIENIQHLFFSCPISWQIWNSCIRWWGFEAVLQQEPIAFVESWRFIQSRKGKFRRQLWDSLFFVIIWSIWFERNKIKFQNKEFSLSNFKQEIKLRLGLWIKCYQPTFPYSPLQVATTIEGIWDWQPNRRKK